MDIRSLQATLRRFAAERHWQPFHTPKNLTTALMVEAAELAEIFQWMTAEESREAHTDPSVRQRIQAELADVMLYLLQVADHTETDLAQAVQDKLAQNARKYPLARAAAPMLPAPDLAAEAPTGETHVLLDYENVQPSEDELRTLVPEATRVWVFHGPHQKDVERRFASFGDRMTPVPISRTGKNALDFHLSFYMGYIASRHQAAQLVVIANDKGYQPMLEHAQAMGFAVRQLGHARVARPAAGRPAPRPAGEARPAAATRALAKKVRPAKAPAQPDPVKKTAPRGAPAAKAMAAKAPAKKARTASPGQATRTVAPSRTGKKGAPAARPAEQPAASPALLQKLSADLRKMGQKRPAKAASLRRALGPLLGKAESAELVAAALEGLIARGDVVVGASGGIDYPRFASRPAGG